MSSKNSFYIAWTQLVFCFKVSIILVYIICIYLGYKEFTIWSQVGMFLFDYAGDEQYDMLVELFETKHPHAMRVSLIYPIFQLSEILNIDVQLLYSFTILSLFLLIYKLIVTILEYYSIRQFNSLILIFLLVLSLFMHGRIAFAMFGNTLILYVLFMKTYYPVKMNMIKFLLYTILSLWLSSVSSGTLIVGIGTIVLFYTFHLLLELPYIQKKYIYLFSIILIVFIMIFPMILQLINKNLDYYDASFLLMLDHGFGKYIVKYFYIVGAFLVLFPFIVIKFLYFLRNNEVFILPLSMIITSLLIGSFGISALVSGVSGYILFFYVYLNKKSLRIL